MDELINGLVSKVGLSLEQAKKAVNFLKENVDKVPSWLGLDMKSLTDKLPAGLGSIFKG